MAFVLSMFVCRGPLTAMAGHVTVASPDGRLMVTVENQQFSVEYDGQQVVLPSALGLSTSLGDFTKDMKYVDCHEETISKEYDMRQAKASHIKYEANQLVLDYQTTNVSGEQQ